MIMVMIIYDGVYFGPLRTHMYVYGGVITWNRFVHY